MRIIQGMRKADTIEGLTDKVDYLQALVDAGSLDAIEPFLKARNKLKRAMEGANALRKSNR